MKKSTAYILGALTTLPAAWLWLHHQRQKDLDSLLEQRLRLQKQISRQQQLLRLALAALEEAKANGHEAK